MLFWAFVVGGAAAIVGIWFLHHRSEVQSAADRALTVPGSVKDKLPGVVKDAVQSVETKAKAAVDGTIAKV